MMISRHASSIARLVLLAVFAVCLCVLAQHLPSSSKESRESFRLFGHSVSTGQDRWMKTRLLTQAAVGKNEHGTSSKTKELVDIENKKSIKVEEKWEGSEGTESGESNVNSGEGEEEGAEIGEGKEEGKEKEEEKEEEPGEVLITYIVTVILVIGGICREIKKVTGIPYTPMLLVSGILLGTYANKLGDIGHAFWLLMQINPHGILMIFIPTIIFESAFNSDPFTIKRQIWQILLLAVPGVILGAFLIAVSFNYVLGYYTELSIWASLTFGAIVCATDPVAVVALLKELGTPLKFNVLLEGESLLNDGTAMVFYIMFSSIYKAQGITVLGVIWKFIQLSIGGVLFGAVVCVIAILWLRRIVKDEILTIAITFMACYATFFIGEVYLGVSGILALVSLGVLMAMFGRFRINPESEHSLHTVWTFIQYVLETIIFVLTGGYIGYYTIYSDQSSITSWDWIRMFFFYFLMTLARFIMIYVFKPLMNMSGYPITIKDIFVLSYGGLRGAIALCLGLMVYTDEDYTQRFRDLVLFYLTGMITMTVLFNGLTMKWVMLQIDIFPENKTRTKVKNTLIKSMVINGLKQEQKIKNNRFLTLANWNQVEELSGITSIVKTQANDFHGQEMISLNQPNNSITQEQTLIEIRYRVYRLIKAQFGQKFEESFCGSSVVSMLNESVDFCMDSLEEKVWIYECVSENIIGTDKLQNWLSYRNTLIIGPIYKSFLNNYLLQTYEMLSTLIVSLEELLENKPNIPLAQQYVNVIFTEVSQNKEKAEQQLFLLCDIFPDLIGSLQSKQAAQMVLRAQKDELTDDHHNGLITDDEFSSLVDDINKRISLLNRKELSWEIEGVKNFSLVSPVFQNLGEIDLQKLNNSHVLNKFPPNSVIYKKGQAVHGIYIISSGMVEDAISEDVKTRFGLGAVLSWPNILTSDGLAKSTLTSVNQVTAYFIPKDVLMTLFESNLSFEESIYKGAIPAFFRLYPSTYMEIDISDEMINHIQKNCKLLSKQEGEIVSLEFGGFLISGQMKLIDEDSSQGPMIISTPQFIKHTPGVKNYKVEKKIKLIRFEASILDFEDDQEDMRRSIMVGFAQNQSNLSPPVKGSFRRTSAKNSIAMMYNKEKDVEKLFETLIKTRFRHLAN